MSSQAQTSTHIVDNTFFLKEEGRREGRKGGRDEGREVGMEEGWEGGRKEGRKEGLLNVLGKAIGQLLMNTSYKGSDSIYFRARWFLSQLFNSAIVPPKYTTFQ